MKIRTTLVLFSLALFAACSTVALTGRKQLTLLPSSQMLSLASDNYDTVLNQNKISENEAYISMVRNAGSRVSNAVEQYMSENGMESRISNYEWEFNVLASDKVNAWCMPGGKIAFYEGIMPICRDETGVAVVMAHEIAHAVARHGNERLSQQLTLQLGGMALSEALEKEKETTQQLAMLAFGLGTQLGVVLPYSRTHEKEADEMGLYFAAMAGYDPREAIEFWERMKQQGGARVPEFLSTHPHPETRIRKLKDLMPEAMKYYER